MMLKKLNKESLLHNSLIIVLLALSVCLSISVALYSTQFREVQKRLESALWTQASIVQSVLKNDDLERSDEPFSEARLALIVDAFRNNTGIGIGGTSEYVLGKRKGDSIVFLLEQRLALNTVPDSIPPDGEISSWAQPMRRALAGETGTMVGEDYRGEKVIAVYTCMDDLGMGIVLKVDFSEFLYPYLRDVSIVIAAMLIFAVIGVLLYCAATGKLLGRLEESERKSRIQLERIEDQKKALDFNSIVSISDSNGKICYANDHFCKKSGYTREEIYGETHHLISSGYHDKRFFQDIWDTILSGSSWRGAIKNKTKYGEHFWVDTAIVPFRGSQGGIDQFIAIQTDITKQKEYEAELITSRKKAEEANVEKSRFLANMSHEIRTPLNAILGFSELLSETELDEEQSEMLTTIRSSGEALVDTISDILDISKLESGEETIRLVEVGISEMVSDLLSMFSLQADGNRLSMSSQINLDRTIIFTDPVYLRRILVNLLSNAVKFTYDGEVCINVSSKRTKDQQETINVNVVDTGIGIPQSMLDRIFDKFIQVDSSSTRKFGGTGLGLSIAKGCAELLGGELTANSIEGKGSCFELSIPVVYQGECAALKHKKRLISENGKYDGSILIAEDNKTNLDVLICMLARFGLEADVAENGKEVLAKIARKKYDLILMDCNMPMMDGFEATREARRLERENQTRRTAIIAVTAKAMKVDRDECLRAGMDDYLSKPYCFSGLKRVLDQNLRPIENSVSSASS